MGNLKNSLVVFYFFYREKLKNESEKSNVTVTSRNATEKKRRKDNKRNKKRRKYKRGGKQWIQRIQIVMMLYTIDSKIVDFVVKNYNQLDLIISMQIYLKIVLNMKDVIVVNLKSIGKKWTKKNMNSKKEVELEIL